MMKPESLIVTGNNIKGESCVGASKYTKHDHVTRWPKISIITPSFNQGEYIEQTILSVLDQNYPNLEFIVIDGGSTDQTIGILRKYEEHITYWISEPDRGQSHAINKGLEKCTGDIVNWLNSDDWLMPDSLFVIADAFLKNPDIKVVSGYENHIGIDGSITVSKGTFLKKNLEETIELCQVAQPSTFFRMNAFKQIAPVPEDIHYIMDGELWVRFLLLFGQNCFYKIHEPLVNFRLHENSKTVSNTQVNNFLFERSSIIVDLQKFVGVPLPVVDFWITGIFGTSTIYTLNRSWKLNSKILPGHKLRLYFLRKFTNYQFQYKNNERARWGVLTLVKNYDISWFTLKSIIKLLFN